MWALLYARFTLFNLTIGLIFVEQETCEQLEHQTRLWGSWFSKWLLYYECVKILKVLKESRCFDNWQRMWKEVLLVHWRHMQPDLKEIAYESNNVDHMKLFEVHPNLTTKNNHHWRISRLYENIQMMLYNFIWIIQIT